jgi:hypothetical protein
MSVSAYRSTVYEVAENAPPPPPPATFGYKFYWQGEPPVEFFTKPPPDAKAIFSTKGRALPLRSVENPTLERPCEPWHAVRIQKFIDELRNELPQLGKYVSLPLSYLDLYHYFDAFDIYYCGAQNLWNVINRMFHENQIFMEECLAEANPMFDEWVTRLLMDEKCRERLFNWIPTAGQDILDVFTFDETFTIHGMETFYLPFIRNIVLRHYYRLHNENKSPSKCLVN